MNIKNSDSIHKTAGDILMYDINNGNLEDAYALLKDGEVDLNLSNKLGVTPLHVLLVFKISK